MRLAPVLPSLALCAAIAIAPFTQAAPKADAPGKGGGKKSEPPPPSLNEPAPADPAPSTGTVAYTDPMGGSVMTVARSVLGGVFISCPYIHENDFIGTVSGVADGSGSSTISVDGAPFVASAFDESSLFPRYYMEITEVGHPFEGYSFDIISNTADAIVVAAELAADFGIAAGDAIQIRKHMTLDDFFANAESSFGAFLETVKFFNYDGSIDFYTWTGTIWSPDYGITDVGERNIYPGEGFLATFSSNLTFIVSGKVKTTKTVVPIPPTTVTPVFCGSASPVEETLGSLQLATAGFNDYLGTVKFISNDGYLTTGALYTDFGSFMTADFGMTDGSSVPVPSGSALQIANAGVATNLVLPAPYTP